jgi:hypothetical protein
MTSTFSSQPLCTRSPAACAMRCLTPCLGRLEIGILFGPYSKHGSGRTRHAVNNPPDVPSPGHQCLPIQWVVHRYDMLFLLSENVFILRSKREDLCVLGASEFPLTLLMRCWYNHSQGTCLAEIGMPICWNVTTSNVHLHHLREAFWAKQRVRGSMDVSVNSVLIFFERLVWSASFLGASFGVPGL